MKKLKRITAASEDKMSEALDNQIDSLKDDFDYAIDGLSKLSRMGVNSSNDAMAIAENFHNALQTVINDIANKVVE
nr:MAG TPA: hypothetical protein [Caudoviricetes sp.]